MMQNIYYIWLVFGFTKIPTIWLFLLIFAGFWRWRGLPRNPGGPIPTRHGLQKVYIKCTGHAGWCHRQDQIWCHSKTGSLERQGLYVCLWLRRLLYNYSGKFLPRLINMCTLKFMVKMRMTETNSHIMMGKNTSLCAMVIFINVLLYFNLFIFYRICVSI